MIERPAPARTASSAPRRAGRIRGPMVAGLALVLVACSLSPEMEPVTPFRGPCPVATVAAAGPAPSDSLALRWYRPVERRDVELTARWCATVGPPVIRLGPTLVDATWGEDRDLLIFSWNMALGDGDLVEFLAREADLRCERPGADVRPFVLLLQEAWRRSTELPLVEDPSLAPWTMEAERGPGSPGDVVEVARRCGLALVYVPSARNGLPSGARPDEDKGNAILSSLPLTEPLAFDLPFEAGRKVAVAASVAAPGGQRVRVVSVHLDVASTLFRTLLSGNRTRLRQTEGVLDALKKVEEGDQERTVTVVGGDFNTWSAGDASLKLMRRRFPDSPTWDGLDTFRPVGLPLDHIFVRLGASCPASVAGYRRLDEHYGSDHFGRRLELHFDASDASGEGPQARRPPIRRRLSDAR